MIVKIQARYRYIGQIGTWGYRDRFVQGYKFAICSFRMKVPPKVSVINTVKTLFGDFSIEICRISTKFDQ